MLHSIIFSHMQRQWRLEMWKDAEQGQCEINNLNDDKNTGEKLIGCQY